MSKNATIITWIVIIIIILILGGFWWYYSQNNMTTTTTTQSSDNSITSFNFENLNPPVTGNVDNTNDTVSLMVPKGTDVTNLTPTIAVADNATISPASGTAQDFTNPVMYTVTAQDGSTQTYTVTVTVATDSIKISSKTGLGQFLTDSNGMTLYYFTTDKKGSGQSACNGQCATTWPPFNTSMVTVSSPLLVSNFTTITRADGSQQLTYKGWPLYYYAQDAASGDTNGQGVGGTWFVVKP